MPHEIAFVDSVLQAPVRLLGLKLRPYSIGMELLLKRQRNPLVILDGLQFSLFSFESQQRAVQNAALICYRSWKENQKPERNVKFWKWRVERLCDHAETIKQFTAYRNAGSSFPPPPSDIAREVTKKSDNEGRSLGAPFLARLFAFVAGLPDREIKLYGDTAFDFPLGFASFLYLSHLEHEGTFQIENEKEAQIQRDFEAQMAEIPAERRVI